VATITMCDACGQEMDPYERLMLTVPANFEAGIVGGAIDLCQACSVGVEADEAVQKAMARSQARAAERAAAEQAAAGARSD
jgi:hypothetical protein